MPRVGKSISSVENGKKGGRPKGTTGILHQATITKAEQREIIRATIAKHADRMLQAQIAHAVGIGHLYTRDKSGKFTRIENANVADKLLTEGTEGEDYYITMKDPSVQAFTDLMNRAFDKPKEQEQDVNLKHAGGLTIRIEKPW